MNTFLYLLIGHFYADYPFQPTDLVAYKKKNFSGVVIHASIHFLVTLIVFLPFLEMNGVWEGLVAVLITHSAIDQTKIWLNKKNPKLLIPLYFVDQITHILVALVIANYIGILDTSAVEYFTRFYQDNSVALYILLLPVVTYFLDVTRYHIRFNKGLPFKRDFKMMITNAVIVTVAFGLYWIS